MQRGQQGASRAKVAENLAREPRSLSHLLPRGRPGKRRMKQTQLKSLLRLLWEMALGRLHSDARSPGLKQGGGTSLTVAIVVHSGPSSREGFLPSVPALDQFYNTGTYASNHTPSALTGMFLLDRGCQAEGPSSRIRPPRL